MEPANQPPTRNERWKSEKTGLRRPGTSAPTAQRVVLWASALIVLGLTVLIIVNLSRPPRAPSSPGSPEPVELMTTDWVKGPAGAKTVLIEYSDFQCPACGSYHPILRKLLAEFGDRMRFAYRHFPLKQHPNAEPAARAAEAAGRQGKFWEMHDLLFEGQSTWSDLADAEGIFDGYARRLGLDLARFHADLNSAELRKTIEEDRRSGSRLNLPGTPSFFLNGTLILNPEGYDEFRKILQQSVRQDP